MFDNYGRTQGFGQIAPGRDLPDANNPRRGRRFGQPDVNAAITGGIPQGGADTPFAGAQQTTQPLGQMTRNMAAGYDVNKWNSLPQTEKNQYIAQGGAPNQGTSALMNILSGLGPVTGTAKGAPLGGVGSLPSFVMGGQSNIPPGGETGGIAGPHAGGTIQDTTSSAPTTPTTPSTGSSNANNGRMTVYHPDKAGIFGFETSKLQDPNFTDTKYSPAAKAMSTALGEGVQMGRGNLDGLVNAVKAKGFPNAKVVSEDAIDFGDGNGPIDVLGDQGNGKDLIQFMNTTGNAQWESKYGKGGGAAGAPAEGHPVTGPVINQAVLGTVPTVNGGQQTDYAQLMQKQILQALQLDPRFAQLAGGYGY